MSRRFWKLLALFVAFITLLILAIWWTTPTTPPTRPQLSVTYIATINGNGHWRLKFGVTNVSSRTIVTYQHGYIEVFGRTNKLSVGATAPMARLTPGQGHFVEAVISDQQMASLDGSWRSPVSTQTIIFARGSISGNGARAVQEPGSTG
jgi:hypothetical protein